MPETNDLFVPIVQDAAGVVFEPAAGVRHRGASRRRRRRAVAAGLAALAVAGVAVTSTWALGQPTAGPDVAASTSPTPTPSATPSGSPSPTSTPSATPTTSPPGTGGPIPPEALLTPADVGTGYARYRNEIDDHRTIEMMLSYCGQSDGAAREHRLWNEKWDISRGTGVYVSEEVSRYEPGWAARHMRDIRAAAPRCPTIDQGGNPEFRSTFTVVATDFAGTGSILIRDVDKNQTEYLAVVHQGDVEARMRIAIGANDGQARAIATKAAERLCAATPTC